MEVQKPEVIANHIAWIGKSDETCTEKPERRTGRDGRSVNHEYTQPETCKTVEIVILSDRLCVLYTLAEDFI